MFSHIDFAVGDLVYLSNTKYSNSRDDKWEILRLYPDIKLAHIRLLEKNKAYSPTSTCVYVDIKELV